MNRTLHTTLQCNLQDIGGRQQVVQPVGAEQKAILSAHGKGIIPDRHFHLGMAAQGTCHHVSVLMVKRLFCGQDTLPHQFACHRMVFCHLKDLAVAQ